MKKIIAILMFAIGVMAVSSCQKTSSKTDFTQWGNDKENLVQQYYDKCNAVVDSASSLKGIKDGFKSVDKFYEDTLLKKREKEVKKFRKDCAADTMKCVELAKKAAQKNASFEKKKD